MHHYFKDTVDIVNGASACVLAMFGASNTASKFVIYTVLPLTIASPGPSNSLFVPSLSLFFVSKVVLPFTSNYKQHCQIGQ